MIIKTKLKIPYRNEIRYPTIWAIAKAWSRGNKIMTLSGRYWIYTIDGKSLDKENKQCVRCGERPTKEGHDACLGTIDNISYACCGHGVNKSYYKY